MPKICITAETTIDLPKELLEEFDIKIIPFTIVLGEEQAKDGEVTSKDLFDYVDRTGKLPRTSAINTFQYADFFLELLKDYDEIVHFSLSSGISSACSNAIAAVSENHLENRVFVIDSRTLSTGIALQAFYAAKLLKKGYSGAQIKEKVEKRIPYDQASFIIQQLNYLYKGGRCSKLAMFGANILKIKPQIVVADGVMAPGKKYRGKTDRTILEYVDDTLDQFNNPDLEQVFITYTTADPDTVAKIKEKLEMHGFKRIDITQAGGTIACHCGPETLGILYFNDGNENHD
ncbi:MAG: DegV family protein [Bacilli bacterium]|nr:DegV family protein [Bacilli bacterium]